MKKKTKKSLIGFVLGLFAISFAVLYSMILIRYTRGEVTTYKTKHQSFDSLKAVKLIPKFNPNYEYGVDYRVRRTLYVDGLELKVKIDTLSRTNTAVQIRR
jgi:hypothetical protein